MKNNERLVYTDTETGNVCVVIPVPGRTEAQVVDRSGLTGKSYRKINVDKLPTSRNLRGSWTDAFATDTVDIDAVKAQDVIRAKRNKSLDSLDAIAVKEQRKPAGNSNAVELEATRLRDLTSKSEFNSSTETDLEASWAQADIDPAISAG